MDLNIFNLVDDSKCYEAIRNLRWGNGCQCPHCDSCQVIKRGADETHNARQRYECKNCHKRFDDLTNTVFSGHHQPGPEIGRGRAAERRRDARPGTRCIKRPVPGLAARTRGRAARPVVVVHALVRAAVPRILGKTQREGDVGRGRLVDGSPGAAGSRGGVGGR